MSYDIHVYHLAATPAAVIRARVAPDRVAGWLRRAYRSVGERLASDGIAPAGPAFACYTVDGDAVEVEAGYPVRVALDGDGLVMPSGLPGGPAAVTVHKGGLERVDAAYRRIGIWLARHHLRSHGRHWEQYLVGLATNDGDRSRWRTEIVVPYRWDTVLVGGDPEDQDIAWPGAGYHDEYHSRYAVDLAAAR